MKRNYAAFLLMLLLLAVYSCRNQSSQKGKPAGGSPEECLYGTWAYIEDNFEKSFTFNSDLTGTEIYAKSESRTFTWVIMNGRPTIVYNGENNQWSFDLNCNTGELNIFGMIFRKK